MIESSGMNEKQFNIVTDGQSVKDQARQLMHSLLCEERTPDCYMRTCAQCKPNTQKLVDSIEQTLIDNEKENIRFEVWESTDKMAIQVKESPADEFALMMGDKLEAFAKHHFIVREQERAYKEIRENLPLNHALCVADFA